MKEFFDTLIFIARPAAGKSEIINYLTKTPLQKRLNMFHIANIKVFDDFPMLWAWFEEDEILENLGYSRLHTDQDGYFLYPYLWDVLIERINLEYSKYLRDKFARNRCTKVIEFSRGKEHGGYRSAFQLIYKEILQNAAILYVNVSWEESLRKNRKRFNSNKPDSILEHSLPDEKLKKLYYECEFQELAAGESGILEIQGIDVPYVVFENEDDVTTAMGNAMGDRLENTLGDLWHFYSK